MVDGRLSEDSFYQAISGFEQNNRERLNVSDMMKWLKKNEQSICTPYGYQSGTVLLERFEAEKPLKKIVKKHGGDDVVEPFCLNMYDQLVDLDQKKPKFKKKDYKYL